MLPEYLSAPVKDEDIPVIVPGGQDRPSPGIREAVGRSPGRVVPFEAPRAVVTGNVPVSLRGKDAPPGPVDLQVVDPGEVL